MENRKHHRDKDGNPTGSSGEVEGLLGGRREEHRDTDGNTTGSSEEREYLLGGRYTQHFDSQNNPAGTSTSDTSILGNSYTRHYDSKGRATGRSEQKTSLLGNNYIEHFDQNGNFMGTTLQEDTPTARDETKQRRSIASRISPAIRNSGDDGWNGIGFLLALLVGLTLLVIFVYVGVPILAGYWLAKLANRKLVSPVPDRHRWRWAILPSVFTVTALTTNELIATAVGALQCSEPQSIECSNYRRRPAPTVLGLHRQLVQQGGMALTNPPSQDVAPTVEPYSNTASSGAHLSRNQPEESQLTGSAAVELINNWLMAKPRIFAHPFDANLAQGLVAKGPLWHDITKPGGSLDWLQTNNSHYLYHSNKITGVERENLTGSTPSLTASIYEDSTIQSPKGAKRSASTRNYTYTFIKEDGHWKIYDYN